MTLTARVPSAASDSVPLVRDRLDRPIVLVGMPGAGKSRVGKIVADRLGLQFRDADAEVEHAAGMPIAQIFERLGEAAFRSAERRVIQRLLGEGTQVLALGGGAFADTDTRAAVAEHAVAVFLKADIEELERRTARSDRRPLLSGPDRKDRLRQLMTERMESYETADLIVPSDARPPSSTAEAVIEALAAYLTRDDS